MKYQVTDANGKEITILSHVRILGDGQYGCGGASGTVCGIGVDGKKDMIKIHSPNTKFYYAKPENCEVL